MTYFKTSRQSLQEIMDLYEEKVTELWSYALSLCYYAAKAGYTDEVKIIDESTITIKDKNPEEIEDHELFSFVGELINECELKLKD